ncbi:hypothetical protein CHLNCDRAFT_134327 [Chlorella variabilis]|uniref:30S ribosomal protein S15 n=1 Tax=Chlorella variabilis TaxID=554065 RepID=E1ZFS4_CHLVA|nr:hypothetical protein CHLNCDRAFT_134327 [Chlorella variabilis]EFN55331.1 hypothetical protein CHLNCDRAFT_134327 [Chlorella variabilis]|eukprot:XP_005847433.1 hypothetical protein CHLNCDRAFT_134327 [Chlorella variabilis]
MLRNVQRLASSLLVQAEACSTSCSGSSSWEALRGISSTACAQRRLFPAGEPVRPEDVVSTIDRPYLVDKLLSPELMNRQQHKKLQRREVLREFERFPGDTGSTEVQVGVLTRKIADMAEHMRQHRKDYSSRRGLEAMLNQRRKLLQYLRRSKFDKYAVLISRLGLKDSYGPQDRLSSRYKPAPTGGAK